jgi:urea transport system substrate-binding protein
LAFLLRCSALASHCVILASTVADTLSHGCSKVFNGARRALVRCVAVSALFGLILASPDALGADTIKVGVLFSLSGTMADAEIDLKNAALMTIAEINAHGGVLGRQLEPVVVDPASNWPLYAERARELLTRENVAVIFGCWTSVSRKSVEPVFQEQNGLLLYPVQYEGQELERNVFYTGATPNQLAIPAAEYLQSKEGGSVKRWVLLGTDYVTPRVTFKILRAFLESTGVADADILEVYTRFAERYYREQVDTIRAFAAQGKKTAVVSALFGESKLPFHKALRSAGITAGWVPVMNLALSEGDLRDIDPKPFVGDLAVRSYFQTLETPENVAFRKKIAAWIRERNLPHSRSLVVTEEMEATYVGIRLWKQAVERALTTDVDQVIPAFAGQRFKAPSGFELEMDLKNHHLHKPVFIARVGTRGQLKVIWGAKQLLKAQPWSPFIPESSSKPDEPEQAAPSVGSGP